MKKIIISSILTSVVFSIGLTFLLSEKKPLPITIEFDAEVDHDMIFSCYYTTAPDKYFSEEEKVNFEIKSGNKQKVVFSLPCTILQSFRLDFYRVPHTIKLSEIYVYGNKTYTYSYNNVHFTNDIDTATNEEDWFKITSEKEDPFVGFSNVCIEAGHETNFSWVIFLLSVLFSSIIFYYLYKYIFSVSEKIGLTDTLFIFLFIFFLFIPGLKFDDQEISTEENRTLAAKPVINQKKDILTFGKDYENWFNDHFWCRKIFIDIHKKITETINNDERKIYDQAFLGKNGWFFLNNTRGYSNNPIFSNFELKDITSYLETIDSWCKENNMKFYFVIGPDKNKIYGEHYKYTKKIRPDEEGAAYQLLEYLNKNTNINCIYPAEAIKAHKNDSTCLYYKNDTHWNHKGAYYAYLELMKQINKQDSIPLAKISGWYEYTLVDGDLNRMCNGLQVDPDVKYLHPIFENTNEISVSIPHNIPTVEPYPHGIIKGSCTASKKKGVILGDSFTPRIYDFLSNSFGETLRIQNGLYEFSQEVQNLILEQKADYFVLVTVERFLPVLRAANFAENKLDKK